MSRPVAAPLVIAAHGSRDPRFAVIVESLARQVRHSHRDLDVRIGYLDHGTPDLAAAATTGSIVVPLLLSSGHHVRVDIPAQAVGCDVTAACGPDPALLPVLQRRLREAGWSGGGPVTLAAAGSTDADALAEVIAMGQLLAGRLGVEVNAGFVSAGQPRVQDLPTPAALASYLLAPGQFHTALVDLGVPVVADPIGDAPELADIIVDRYQLRVGQRR